MEITNSNLITQRHKEQMELQIQEIKKRLGHIKNKLMVMSCKSGVGKSSVAAYLSVALAQRGYRVALMNVDPHDPSIQRILGVNGNLLPAFQDGKILPIRYLPTMEAMSIVTHMGDENAATVWQGPSKGGVIRQFIADIEWMDNLDYMIIDSKPGTGGEQRTVAQTIPDAKALIVTTPQEMSLADFRKLIHFCCEVKMDILGMIENMSGLRSQHCDKMIDLLETCRGMDTEIKKNLQLLGCLPIEPQVVGGIDVGDADVLKNYQLGFTRAFHNMVDVIENLLGNKKSLSTSGTG